MLVNQITMQITVTDSFGLRSIIRVVKHGTMAITVPGSLGPRNTASKEE
jgi:hypothetical protein